MTDLTRCSLERENERLRSVNAALVEALEEAIFAYKEDSPSILKARAALALAKARSALE